jgi:hypothetical protein
VFERLRCPFVVSRGNVPATYDSRSRLLRCCRFGRGSGLVRVQILSYREWATMGHGGLAVTFLPVLGHDDDQN